MNNKYTIIKCKFCGKPTKRLKVVVKQNKNTFCSVKCRAKYITNEIKKKRKKVKCGYCKKILYISNFYAKKNKNNFCSHKCMGKYNKGKSIPSGLKNEKHHNWKGNKVGYSGLHKWIKRNKPKPKFCEDCKEKKPFDLANISGEYKRDIKDFKWVCRGCHIKMDRLNKKVIEDKIIKIEKVKCDKVMWDIETGTKNFIADGIITHNSKRGKKSRATKTYLPSVKKEKIDVCVCIDVSGSIGKEELTDFVGEIIGMAKAYQGCIGMTLITHECEVVDRWDINNGNINEIKKIKIKGGGGTSFNPVAKWINENIPRNKAVIWLTDGYGDEIKEKTNYPIIWVVTKDGSDELMKDRKQDIIVWLKKTYNE